MMARKVKTRGSTLDELYEVIDLLLVAVNTAFPKPGPIIGALIRRAEAALKARS